MALLERCQKIMDREKWSFNKFAEEAFKEYELRHGAGNSSFQLDKFGITWTKAQSIDKCCFRGCGKLAVGVGLYVPKKQTFGLCAVHFGLVKQSSSWADLKCPK